MESITPDKTQEDHIKELRARAMRLPLHPGVYIMQSKAEPINDIGQPEAMTTCVRQYVGPETIHEETLRKLITNVEYFEFTQTDSQHDPLSGSLYSKYSTLETICRTFSNVENFEYIL